jgi:hypothetical protein
VENVANCKPIGSPDDPTSMTVLSLASLYSILHHQTNSWLRQGRGVPGSSEAAGLGPVGSVPAFPEPAKGLTASGGATVAAVQVQCAQSDALDS